MSEVTFFDEVKYIKNHSKDEVLLRQIAEECMELGQACLKAIRALNDDEYVSATYDDIFENILEEKADVDNTFHIWSLLVEDQTDQHDAFGIVWHVDYIAQSKIHRWYTRLQYLNSIAGKADALMDEKSRKEE